MYESLAENIPQLVLAYYFASTVAQTGDTSDLRAPCVAKPQHDPIDLNDHLYSVDNPTHPRYRTADVRFDHRAKHHSGNMHAYTYTSNTHTAHNDMQVRMAMRIIGRLVKCNAVHNHDDPVDDVPINTSDPDTSTSTPFRVGGVDPVVVEHGFSPVNSSDADLAVL